MQFMVASRFIFKGISVQIFTDFIVSRIRSTHPEVKKSISLFRMYTAQYISLFCDSSGCQIHLYTLKMKYETKHNRYFPDLKHIKDTLSKQIYVL